MTTDRGVRLAGTVHAGVLLAAVGFVAGCGGNKVSSRPLTAQDFINDERPPVVGASPNAPVDQPGALPPNRNRSKIDLLNPPQPPPQEPIRAISPTVEESVQPPGQAKSSPPTTELSTTAPVVGPSSGTYQTVGGVVAVVNANPIYANKVLNSLNPVLAAKARDLSADRFRSFASEQINRQVSEYVRAELEFAAAQQALDEKDRKLADQLTTQWRSRQVTLAGGSAELAKKRAAANGDDFDDLAQQQYRTNMVRIYYQRRLIPRIQVTANDMRHYYDQHLNDQFTEHAAAHFLLVKIDPDKTGSRAAALDKATDIQKRAARGEDFGTIAGQTNDDPRLMKTHGDVGFIDKGSFRLEKVEKAALALDPGKVSDVMEDDGGFYVVKLLEKKEGRVAPFDEEKVQDTIREKLRSEQFREMREKVQGELRSNAIVQTSPDMINIAIEMAMQNYPRWAKASSPKIE